MDPYSDSSERGTTDFILFGLGFIGFLLGVGGIIVSSIGCALGGGLLLLMVILWI
jgi:hypothetical protein